MNDVEIAVLLRQLAGTEPCDYDHHGYCQTHWGENGNDFKCPHEQARHLLAGGERYDLAGTIVRAATEAHEQWDRIRDDPELTQIVVAAAGLFDILVGIHLTNPTETAEHLIASLRGHLHDIGKSFSEALRNPPDEGT